jgi:hypothetical protein
MTDIEKDQLLDDLMKSVDVIERRKERIASAKNELELAEAGMLASKLGKIFVAAKCAVGTATRELADARDSHDAIERELRSGMTGLSLFDAGKPDRPPVAEAVAR